MNQQDQSSQNRVVDFLASGKAFGGEVPEHIETHVSHVFLTQSRAYKMKRALTLNFLDFSTLEQRRWACEREIELNALGAPGLYLRTVPVVDDGAGLALGGDGVLLEWLVEMKRFDSDEQLDRMARKGLLTRPIASALAERVIAFHQGAQIVKSCGGAAAMQKTASGIANNLRTYGAPLLDVDAVAAWDAGVQSPLAEQAGRLDKRREAGFVRQCHGDLHLSNICIHEGAPLLFDCIEFNDEIACVDVLYDLAFLIMDLIFEGHTDHANLILSRYLSTTRDFDGLPLLPIFLSMRASVRAMTGVIGLATEDGPTPGELDEARRHLSLALDLLETPVPQLVAVGGLSGSGKSTLSAKLSTRIAPSPGAIMVSSDVIRKRLAGVSPETPLDADGYTPAMSASTYRRLGEDVARALNAGQTVIADATFIREAGRTEITQMAHELGVPFVGIWLEAPEVVLKQRVEQRANDPSDADSQVIDTQRSQSVGKVDWNRIESTDPALVDTVVELIVSQRPRKEV